MENYQNRLQFVHHDECFATAELAKSYVTSQLDKIDRPSLFAEPMILKYGDSLNPNIILAIGSVGDGVTASNSNRTFFIDSASIENSIKEIEEILSGNTEEINSLKTKVNTIVSACGLNEDGSYKVNIEDDILKVATTLSEADKLLSEYIQKLEKKYNLIVEETNSVKLLLNKEESGETLSANVKIAPFKTVDNIELPSIIITENNGIYSHVDLKYSQNENQLVFSVNGVEKTYTLPTEKYLSGGVYDTKTESIILTLNTGDKISVDVKKLIGEWTVLGESANTTVVLTKKAVTYEDITHGAEEYQDVLTADVRLATSDIKPFNIIKKTDDGRYLYVDGTATNIKYFKDGEVISVQEAIDSVECDISTSSENTIYRRTDGLFATVDMKYDPAFNTITFIRSNYSGGTQSVTYTLNSAQLLQDVSYDSVREVIVLRFKTADGNISKVEIPVGDIITEWNVDNTNSTVTLIKTRSVSGTDMLSANVNIATAEYNILEKDGNAISVRGTADNIHFDETHSVESKITEVETKLTNTTTTLNNNINTLGNQLTTEVTRAKTVEEALSGKTNELSASLNSEINRATVAENTLNDNVQAIQSNLSDEIARAKAEEAKLQLSISTVSSKTQSEIERATTKESALENSINTLQTRTNTLSDEITTETANRKESDNVIKSLVTAEETRAKETEAKLTNSIAINSASTSTLSAKVNEIETSLNTEKTARVESENAIKADIATEISDRKLADDAVKTLVTSEETRAKAAEEAIKTLITAEETRAKAAEIQLESAITKEQISVISTATVNLQKSENNVISANVKNSLTDGNIIEFNADGLYAKSCNLTYDSASNTLTFIPSTGTPKTIVLNSIDTIKSIYFDGTNDTLVFVYTVGGIEKTVTIPAASFFKGIVGTSDGNVTVTTALTTTEGTTSTGITANLDVNNIIDNTNSTVTLKKNTNNTISANVNIADNLPYNIIKEVTDGNAIYADGRATAITATYNDTETNVQAVINSLKAEIEALKTRITELENKKVTIVDDDNTEFIHQDFTYNEQDGKIHVKTTFNSDLNDNF